MLFDMRNFFVVVLMLFSFGYSVAQVVPHHVGNEQVYEFLEEMASIKAVQLNTVVLPLSRKDIHLLLKETETNLDRLNPRQLNELKFFQQEFIKEDSAFVGVDFIGKGLKRGDVFPLKKRNKRYDLFFSKGKLLNFTVNPVVGAVAYYSKGQFYYERSFGISFFGNITKYLSFYGDLRDTDESIRLNDKSFLIQRTGANYKKRYNDFSEMRGGIVASTNWGSLGLVKDNIVWGSAYNDANIFSGRAPSFPMIKLNLQPVKWFSFDYIHAWLASDVVDSAAIYNAGNGDRELLRSKYMAANMFTVRPLKGLHISVGNSVVYADQFNPVYLIPFLFYKSVDHTLNGTSAGSNSRGNNSQMFLNIVSRQLRYLQIYASVYVDEIRMETITDSDKSRNYLSWKIGTRFTTPGKVNLSLIMEYTRTNPLAYRHFVSTTTFESSSYGMGHYLGDNAEEIYLAVLYKPMSRLNLNISFTYMRKGETYPYTSGSDGAGLPFIESERIVRLNGRVRLTYLIAHDIKFALGYEYLTETGPDAYKFLPTPYGQGPHHLSFGVTIGY